MEVLSRLSLSRCCAHHLSWLQATRGLFRPFCSTFDVLISVRLPVLLLNNSMLCLARKLWHSPTTRQWSWVKMKITRSIKCQRQNQPLNMHKDNRYGFNSQNVGNLVGQSKVSQASLVTNVLRLAKLSTNNHTLRRSSHAWDSSEKDHRRMQYSVQEVIEDIYQNIINTWG